MRHLQCDHMINLTFAQKYTKFAKVHSKLRQILNKPSKYFKTI